MNTDTQDGPDVERIRVHMRLGVAYDPVLYPLTLNLIWQWTVTVRGKGGLRDLRSDTGIGPTLLIPEASVPGDS